MSFYISFNRECHCSTHMLDHFISPENILRLAHNTPDHIQILLTLNRVRLSHRLNIRRRTIALHTDRTRASQSISTTNATTPMELSPHTPRPTQRTDARCCGEHTHTEYFTRQSTHTQRSWPQRQGVASCLRHAREGDPIRRVCAATTATTRMLLASCKHEPKQE